MDQTISEAVDDIWPADRIGMLFAWLLPLHSMGHTMLIPGLTRAGNVSGVYKSIAATQNQADNTAARTANLADVISISSAARERLAAEASAASGAGVKMDTDKGEVALNLESYFSPKPQGGNGELPPLMLPSQRDIDALTQDINQKFPAFLSANGIPAAPASIQYDSNGQPQFPADYPYAAQLKQALTDNPGIGRELSTVYALGEFKNLLDDSQAFQQEYAAAGSQGELDKVIAKYSRLFSANPLPAKSILMIDADGHIRTGEAAGPSGTAARSKAA